MPRSTEHLKKERSEKWERDLNSFGPNPTQPNWTAAAQRAIAHARWFEVCFVRCCGVGVRTAKREVKEGKKACSEIEESETEQQVRRAMRRGNNSGNYRNPCLTMHQPWASLLVYGIKRVEGRSWPAPITGNQLTN